jgi:hypothetical protein
VSLELYARQEIANVLRGVSFAGEGAAGLALGVLHQAGLDLSQAKAGPKDAEPHAAGVPHGALIEAYCQGFRAALVAVGLAFGLAPEGGRTGPLEQWVRQEAGVRRLHPDGG